MNGYAYPAYVEVKSGRFRERFGLDFEDFKPGQVFRHRPGYTFTQQDNINAALDTLNQAMLHYDNHYAAQTEFGKPLMVTTVILQKLMGMSWKTFYRRKAILGWREVNMLAPVFGGDTLYAESEIMAVDADCDDPQCGLLTVRCRSFKPDQTKTCEASYDCLVYKREHLPFDELGY